MTYDRAAEIGRSPVNKHDIQTENEDEQLTRDENAMECLSSFFWYV